MKTEAGHVGDAAGAALPVFGAERVGGIFDHSQSMRCREIQNRVQIRRMARVIYRKDGSCAWSNLRRDFLRIKVERIGAHVGENRNRALVEDTIRRGGKGQRSSDGFVALLEPGGEGRTVHSRSRGAETHGVFSAYPRRECFLELRHF